MTTNPKESYGAVESKSDLEEYREYDADNSRYLISTAEERRRKCITGSMPVLIFAAIMMGIVYLLSRDFGTLYPGHGSSSSHSESHVDHTISVGGKIETTGGSNENPSKSLSLQNCEANQKCFEAGLTGMCCPTIQGVFLSCCN